MSSSNISSGVSNALYRWDGKCFLCKKPTADRFIQVHSRSQGDVLTQFWCLGCFYSQGKREAEEMEDST
jgi:hypothetical protein